MSSTPVSNRSIAIRKRSAGVSAFSMSEFYNALNQVAETRSALESASERVAEVHETHLRKCE